MFENSVLTIPFYLEILRNHFFEGIGFLLKKPFNHRANPFTYFCFGYSCGDLRIILRVHRELWGCLIGYFEKFVRCFPIAGSGRYFQFAFH